MTDTVDLTIEERLARLEARTGINPLALTPPVTIGELTDVPAPGSQLAAQWAQEVSGRIVHRFPNLAALNGWAAPAGSFAITLDAGVVYRRFGGVWGRYTPWAASGAGVQILTTGGSPVVANTGVTIPADAGPRVAQASWNLRLDLGWPTVGQANLLIGGNLLAYAVVTTKWEQASPGNEPRTVCIVVQNIAINANAPVVINGTIQSQQGSVQAYAEAHNNNLAVTVLPKVA